MLTDRAPVPPTLDVTPPRRPTRRRRRLLALALTGASAAGIVTAERAAVADEPQPPGVQPDRRTVAPAIRTCDHLWDQILVLGLPEQARSSVAEHFGFAQSQDWLSADGLTWEHLDGRLVTVATPRRSPGEECGPHEPATDRTAP